MAMATMERASKTRQHDCQNYYLGRPCTSDIPGGIRIKVLGMMNPDMASEQRCLLTAEFSQYTAQCLHGLSHISNHPQDTIDASGLFYDWFRVQCLRGNPESSRRQRWRTFLAKEAFWRRREAADEELGIVDGDDDDDEEATDLSEEGSEFGDDAGW